VPPEGEPDDERSALTRAAVAEALEELPHARVRWYPGAHHDLHAQHPDALGADLLGLASELP
jgi:pimeloyl-ACP methyl ester carboxylesterase